MVKIPGVKNKKRLLLLVRRMPSSTAAPTDDSVDVNFSMKMTKQFNDNEIVSVYTRCVFMYGVQGPIGLDGRRGYPVSSFSYSYCDIRRKAAPQS